MFHCVSRPWFTLSSSLLRGSSTYYVCLDHCYFTNASCCAPSVEWLNETFEIPTPWGEMPSLFSPWQSHGSLIPLCNCAKLHSNKMTVLKVQLDPGQMLVCTSVLKIIVPKNSGLIPKTWNASCNSKGNKKGTEIQCLLQKSGWFFPWFEKQWFKKSLETAASP